MSPAGIVGWNGLGTQNFILQPLGHPPGVYTVGCLCFVRTASGAGSFAGSVLSWGMIDIPGITTVSFGPSAPTVTGPRLNAYRSIPSSGLQPIIWSVVGAGITGSPIIDLAVFAKWAAFNPL